MADFNTVSSADYMLVTWSLLKMVLSAFIIIFPPQGQDSSKVVSNNQDSFVTSKLRDREKDERIVITELNYHHELHWGWRLTVYVR